MMAHTLYRIILESTSAAFVIFSVYLFIRGYQAMPSKRVVRIVFSIVFVFVTSTIIVALHLKEELPRQIVNFSKLVGGFWTFFFIGFLFAAMLGDVMRLLKIKRRTFVPIRNLPDSTVRFWNLISVFIILTAFSLTGYHYFNKTRVVQLPLTLNSSFYPKQHTSILIASDMHIGNIVRIKRLNKWISHMNSQKPDIVILAGDQFDGNFDESKYNLVSHALKNIRAKFGVYATLGNQEYYIHTEKAVQCMKDAGIVVLRDTSVTIDNKLILVGRDDDENHNRKNLDSLLYGLDSSLPWILVNHRPLDLNETLNYKIDLQLSGHLHNGQIFPFNLIINYIFKYSYGYKKIKNTHFYISSGLGASFIPMRIGTRSEMTRIILTTDNP